MGKGGVEVLPGGVRKGRKLGGMAPGGGTRGLDVGGWGLNGALVV